MSFSERLGTIDRRWLYLVLFLSVAVAVVRGRVRGRDRGGSRWRRCHPVQHMRRQAARRPHQKRQIFNRDDMHLIRARYKINTEGDDTRYKPQQQTYRIQRNDP